METDRDLNWQWGHSAYGNNVSSRRGAIWKLELKSDDFVMFRKNTDSSCCLARHMRIVI